LLDKIAKLEKRISALERTPQLPSSGVNTGSFTIKGGQLRTIRDDAEDQGAISIGSNVSINGEQGMSVNVKRTQRVTGDNYKTPNTGETINGNSVLRVATVDGAGVNSPQPYHTFEVYDKSGDVIFSDTYNGRRGMGHPELHQAFTNSTYFTTTLTTFSFIMSSEWQIYHPNLRVRLLIQNDVGSTSEARVSDGINYSVTIPFGDGFYNYYNHLIPRSKMKNGATFNSDIASINVEHRRVTGAGTVRTQIISVTGTDQSWYAAY
jgi:hypothetical protein